MKQRVLETIKTHELLEDGTHIVLGLSGGPDSVCLFDVLLELSAVKNFRIHPVHVNHKFRPGDAERDQEYVEESLSSPTFLFALSQIASNLVHSMVITKS